MCAECVGEASREGGRFSKEVVAREEREVRLSERSFRESAFQDENRFSIAKYKRKVRFELEVISRMRMRKRGRFSRETVRTRVFRERASRESVRAESVEKER